MEIRFTFHDRTDLHIGCSVFFSPGCQIANHGPVQIGDNVILGPGVKISAEEGRGVVIGPASWLGEKCEIGPGVVIGAGALVTSGSIVQSDVPAYAVVEGSPARVTWHLRYT